MEIDNEQKPIWFGSLWWQPRRCYNPCAGPGCKVHFYPEQSSTLHEQGVPEAELVDQENEDKDKCASIYSGLVSWNP